jgi:hypothetical protein
MAVLDGEKATRGDAGAEGHLYSPDPLRDRDPVAAAFARLRAALFDLRGAL